MRLVKNILRVFVSPEILIKYAWRRFPIGPFELRYRFDAFHKPQYAYGIYRAAILAHSLGYSEISVIEFGVAGGNGLIDMEKISQEVEKITGVVIDIYGFDTGTGLTKPVGTKDMAYEWSEGDFLMDAEGLKKKLKKAKLILGDVRDTVGDFTKEKHAPIGFISFDLDLYSSTKDAFRVLYSTEKGYLPRVYCYFDDIGEEWADCSDYTGERLAINEFNNENTDMKLSPLYGLSKAWYLRSAWTDGMYVLHRFKNKLYDKPVTLQ